MLSISKTAQLKVENSAQTKLLGSLLLVIALLGSIFLAVGEEAKSFKTPEKGSQRHRSQIFFHTTGSKN
jgi:hypothetical protein